MNLRLLALVCLLPAATHAEEIRLPSGGIIHGTHVRPNPGFIPVRVRSEVKGTVQQVGEVVILEGDDEIVSSDGMGGFAIEVDNLAFHPATISQRFFTKYADEFDEIIVFTTFDDSGAQGAAAYELSVKNAVDGIGRRKFDMTGEFGATNGRLVAFVNMMRWDNYEGFSVPITSKDNYLYAVIGQEFAHGWLSFMQYIDANGQRSARLLGRDQSHWASTLQAYASVLDGNELSPIMDGDGYYTVLDSNSRFSPLDLYGMGLIPPSEVPPFFLLQDAVTSTGRKVDPRYPLRVSSKMKGAREDVTIEQVIAAEGPRLPAYPDAPRDFRVAFVLLTRHGETADMVVDAARKLDQVRKTWEESFFEMTGGKGTMCTQVSAPCGAAVARLIDAQIAEAGGNGNQVPEPGEPVQVTFTLENDSPAAAKSVVVRATGPLVGAAAEVAVGDLAASEKKTALMSGSIPADAACGVPLTLEAESVVDGHTFRGFARVVPGLTELMRQGFEADDGGFVANKLGSDTAPQNGWAYGTPARVSGRYGYTAQPEGGSASAKAWFTGLGGGALADMASGLGVGTSTLTSAPIDLSTTYKPVLKYAAWYQSVDFSNPDQGGSIIEDLPMIVEGSADGGQTWVKLDELFGLSTKWRQRSVELDGKLPVDGSIVLRFTVSNPAQTTMVEAGLDDVRITTLTQTCDPSFVPPDPVAPEMPKGGGCGCDVGAAGSPAGALWLVGLAVAALALVRRRRA